MYNLKQMRALLFLLIGHHSDPEVALVKANAHDAHRLEQLMREGELSNLRGRQITAKQQAVVNAFAQRNRCPNGVAFNGPQLVCAPMPQPKPEEKK